jgi:hypothetical protein
MYLAGQEYFLVSVLQAVFTARAGFAALETVRCRDAPLCKQCDFRGYLEGDLSHQPVTASRRAVALEIEPPFDCMMRREVCLGSDSSNRKR